MAEVLKRILESLRLLWERIKGSSKVQEYKDEAKQKVEEVRERIDKAEDKLSASVTEYKKEIEEAREEVEGKLKEKIEDKKDSFDKWNS